MSPMRAFLMATVLLVTLYGAAGCGGKPSSSQRQAWERELGRLQAEQDSLRLRSAELVQADPRLLGLPKGDVVIAVPTAFLTSVVERLFTDVVSNVTLHLTGITAHSSQKVKQIVTIGEFTVDIDIKEITGTLKPGIPTIGYGGNRMTLLLPLEVTGGHGEADIHFVWDGKRVAGLTCGDMDVTQKVTGNVVPAAYEVAGSLALEFADNRVVAVPEFPETRVNIRVTPTAESWQAIDAILAGKNDVCSWVLEKVDVKKILNNVVEVKGFNVKLPLGGIKPLELPAGVSETVKVGERVLALDVRTTSLRIDPDAIWYGADVTVASAAPKAVADTSATAQR